MKKFGNSLREHVQRIVGFEKKNVTVNKQRVKITWRWKSVSSVENISEIFSLEI